MIEIRRTPLAIFDWFDLPSWQWTCGVCHYGEHSPWRDVESFDIAWRAVDRHIALHRDTGKRMEWIPVRDGLYDE